MVEKLKVFFFETRTPDTPWHWPEMFWLCDIAKRFFSSVTCLEYIRAMSHHWNISCHFGTPQIFLASLTWLKYFLPVWHTSNISYQSEPLQIFLTTFTWLGYFWTQFICPKISGHNIKGQTFSTQSNIIFSPKARKINGRTTY